MARNEIDVMDIVALVLFPLAAGIELGVWVLQLDVFGGYDFAAPLISGAGIGISPALIATLASLGWIVATNEIDGSDYEDWEFALIAGGFLAVPLYVAVPSVETLLSSYDVITLVVWLLIAADAVYISYTE
ncbi:hypothetical protein [Salinarchaeum laminariae]|uniref:hypothetical protein n=1 Tax=Salinarchaeum laminariae TaxID=869888 RepID=UPI0020BEDF31|nr:hypothetical protein [Salinarchaeum laminariae]